MTPLETTVLQNSSYLASTLIADMEVIGVSRTNKSARLRLLTKCSGLKERVEGQIRHQLRVVLKREEENLGRVVDGSAVSTSPATVVNQVDDEKECKVDDDTTPQPPAPQDTPNLVKIKIRLRENGISVVDEFSVDPHLPSSNPIVLARSLVSDMNLPIEMVNSIAISISEQILGLEVGEELDGMMCNDDLNVVGSGAYWPGGPGEAAASFGKWEVRREIPTAWVMNEAEDSLGHAHCLNTLQLKYPAKRGKD